MKTSLSSSQKPNKLALQPIKACKTFELFQLGYPCLQASELFEKQIFTVPEKAFWEDNNSNQKNNCHCDQESFVISNSKNIV